MHNYATASEILSCSHVGGPSWIQRHNRPALKCAEIARKAGLVTVVEKRVGFTDRSRVDVTLMDYVEHRDVENHPVTQKTAHLDFAVTNPTGPSNRSRRLMRGASAKAYAKKKMHSPGANQVMAPDVFIPCIMETFGLIHSNLQTVLSNIAESHIYLSAKDAGYSVQQQALLKGAIINNYYELMSVALMKGVVHNIHNAVRVLLRKTDVRRGRGPPLTTARGWGIIATAEKTASSNLVEFL